MSGCAYSLGRICCCVAAVFSIALAVWQVRMGDGVDGLLCVLCVAPLLLLVALAPKRSPPEGMPPRLDLSGRVRELALDPQRRSEAVQAYRAETGVSDKEAEKAIADWLSNPSRR